MTERAHLSKVGVHDGLAGGADGDGALQVALPCLGHPCHLHSHPRLHQGNDAVTQHRFHHGKYLCCNLQHVQIDEPWQATCSASDGGAGRLQCTYLGSEAFHMVFLSVEGLLCHKEREAGILDAQLLDLCVKKRRDGLPDEECAGAQDIAACEAKSGLYSLLSIESDIQSCMQETRSRP